MIWQTDKRAILIVLYNWWTELRSHFIPSYATSDDIESYTIPAEIVKKYDNFFRKIKNE